MKKTKPVPKSQYPLTKGKLKRLENEWVKTRDKKAKVHTSRTSGTSIYKRGNNS